VRLRPPGVERNTIVRVFQRTSRVAKS
jgi:hypothetical protein